LYLKARIRDRVVSGDLVFGLFEFFGFRYLTAPLHLKDLDAAMRRKFTAGVRLGTQVSGLSNRRFRHPIHEFTLDPNSHLDGVIRHPT
jgi:hypothetical protein